MEGFFLQKVKCHKLNLGHRCCTAGAIAVRAIAVRAITDSSVLLVLMVCHSFTISRGHVSKDDSWQCGVAMLMMMMMMIMMMMMMMTMIMIMMMIIIKLIHPDTVASTIQYSTHTVDPKKDNSLYCVFYVLLPHIIYVMESGRFSQSPAFLSQTVKERYKKYSVKSP